MMGMAGIIGIGGIGGITGIGGTAGHPRSMPPDTLEAQLSGPVKSALLGADALCGNAIRDAIRQSKVDARALIAADLALYEIGRASCRERV